MHHGSGVTNQERVFGMRDTCTRCGVDHEPHEDAACGCGCGDNPIGCIGCPRPATIYMLQENSDHQWREEMYEDGSDYDSEMVQD
jgi:hypothetical protein